MIAETRTAETEPAPEVLLRRNRAYLLLTTGRFAQAIGAGVGTFAVPLLAFELTGSVAQAGLISGIGQVGALVAGLAGALSGWHLAAVLFGSSMVSAFVNPASGGALRAVVPPAQMANAMAVNQGRMAAVGLFAGPIGGLLYGMAHVLPFVASVVGHAIEAVAVSLVREPLNRERTELSHPLAGSSSRCSRSGCSSTRRSTRVSRGTSRSSSRTG